MQEFKFFRKKFKLYVALCDLCVSLISVLNFQQLENMSVFFIFPSFLFSF